MKSDHCDNGSPLVSIVIVNYKRREALARSLAYARAQTYLNREIIVVDNNSQDDISSFISEHAPEVKLVELPWNSGACGGRNAGIAAASGSIVITLDNDIYFESPREVRKVVAAFEAHPEVHVLAFQLCDDEDGRLRVREWCHPRSWVDFGCTRFETDYFVEGACAYRREVFEKCGGYYEPLFIGCEGHDLALRILNHGFRILYEPRIRLRHLMSAQGRTPERPYYFYTRNYIWIALKDYHFLQAMRFLLPKILMMLYFSVRSQRLAPFIRGIRDGIAGLPKIRTDRTPINKQTAQYLCELERYRPGLLARLARHRTEVQL
jgi:GT2 family glycosyltransferase